MRQFLRTLVEIRRGELAITLLMSCNYYLVLVTYYFLKPARDSLFLVEIGPGQLPVVFMLIAVVAAPVTTFYARAGRALRLNQLVLATKQLHEKLVELDGSKDDLQRLHQDILKTFI